MMPLHLCTISFRHHLASLPELAHWARHCGFDGIELWGVHARHLQDQPGYGHQWIRACGLGIPMVSDYLPVEGPEAEALAHTRQMCRIASHWGARKLRTFAGRRASHNLSMPERRQLARRLRRLAGCVADHGLTLVVETHPGTLADTVEATEDLMTAVDHPAIGVNFDVLHVWESGTEPLAGLRQLWPWVRHFHFKNIRRRDQLSVFAPENVYSPAGCRRGMVPVLEGACDYQPLLAFLAQHPAMAGCDASLEWFGPDCRQVLEQDLRGLRRALAVSAASDQAAVACHGT